MPRKRNQFIITQTPLHTTLIDFWRMVYDHRVTTIVMMDNYKHEDDTCAKYWPTDVTMKQWEPFFIETTAAFQQVSIALIVGIVLVCRWPFAACTIWKQWAVHTTFMVVVQL